MTRMGILCKIFKPPKDRPFPWNWAARTWLSAERRAAYETAIMAASASHWGGLDTAFYAINKDRETGRNLAIALMTEVLRVNRSIEAAIPVGHISLGFEQEAFLAYDRKAAALKVAYKAARDAARVALFHGFIRSWLKGDAA